jgi:dTDP-glucose 4,6-dehydratase
LRNEPITVFGDGSQTRSVCYVSDLVEGIYRLLLSDYAEPVNIGNPDEVTMLQLAQEIKAMVPGSTSTITFEPLPKDDPQVRQPDITLAKKLLGWEPHIQRAEGLKRTLTYFREAIRIEDAELAKSTAKVGA